MKFSIGQRLFVAVLLAIIAVSAAGLAFMRASVMRSFSHYAAKIELDRLQDLSESLQAQYRERAGWGFLPRDGAGRAAWVRTELERLSDKKLLASDLRSQRAQSLQQLQMAQQTIRAAEAQIRHTEAEESALLGRVTGQDNASMDALREAQEKLRQAREQRYAAKAQVLAAKEDVLSAREQLQEIERLQPQSAAEAAQAAADALAAAAAPQAPAAPAVAAPAAAMPAPPAPPDSAAPGPSRHDTVTAVLDQLALQDRITLTDAGGAYLAGRPLDARPTVQRPVLVDGKTVGRLLVAKAPGPSDALAGEFVTEQKRSLALVVLASVALSALASMLLAAHFRKPIHALVDGARLLAKGRFDTRLAIARSDELGELAASFNHLAGKLERTEQSRRQWVADTSHELRTPLSVLRAQIEAMQDGVRPASPDNLATMQRHVLALSKLVDELYELARADEGRFDYAMTAVDLWVLAREEAAGFAEKLHAAGLALRLGPGPARARVLCDPDRIRQVLCNLLENSVRYTSAGGRVELHAAIEDGRLAVLLDDTAPAVPDAALARLAERFFRVEPSRDRRQGGSGLGLAMCRRIVEAHGGTLAFSHSPLGGLRVALTFPLEDA